MVEKKKTGYWLTHAGLIIGVMFIFFPVWLTFVASTVTQEAIIQPPLPLLPGGEFFENYSKRGGNQSGSSIKNGLQGLWYRCTNIT